ncbi:ribonuclease III [Elusimicrobiota bacterium]
MVNHKRKSLDILIDKLGVSFKDRSLLDVALLHKSYSSQHQIKKDNERLEYLGDSILNACVSDMLFHMFPEKSEGELTKIRARLVSRSSLKKWGKELKIKEHIFISEKMKKYMSERETHIIENTMESIIGAMYLDSGFGKAYEFIKKGLNDRDFLEIVDFKSSLQEFSVEKFGEIPVYDVISEDGPSHDKKFKISVSVTGKVYGEGTGSSKKKAQQKAAKQACSKLKIEITDEGES